MNIILWRQRNSKGTDRKQQEGYMNYVTFGGHFFWRVFLEILFDPFVIDEWYGMNWLMYGKTQPRVRSDES